MNAPARVTFFHAPQSRSGGARALFEELGVDYRVISRPAMQCAAAADAAQAAAQAA